MTNMVEEFNSLAFEKKLTQLKDTQESIQSLSSWCLQKRQHHKKIVISWLNVLKRGMLSLLLVIEFILQNVQLSTYLFNIVSCQKISLH